jgi:hypothetical protein
VEPLRLDRRHMPWQRRAGARKWSWRDWPGHSPIRVLSARISSHRLVGTGADVAADPRLRAASVGNDRHLLLQPIIKSWLPKHATEACYRSVLPKRATEAWYRSRLPERAIPSPLHTLATQGYPWHTLKACAKKIRPEAALPSRAKSSCWRPKRGGVEQQLGVGQIDRRLAMCPCANAHCIATLQGQDSPLRMTADRTRVSPIGCASASCFKCRFAQPGALSRPCPFSH